MANRWMDERDREWRRQGHYSPDQHTRGGRDDDERAEYRGGGRWNEERSFEGGDDENDYQGDGGYEGGREKVFGQRETGASYGGETDRYGYRNERFDRDRPGWQNPQYGGVSPAMRRGGGYGHGRFEGGDEASMGREAGRGRSGGRGQGGRYYGDDAREPIYREEWSQGRRDYGQAPGGYDEGYGEARSRNQERRYAETSYGGDDRERGSEPRTWSGGTGGYDYERGYGDGGRSEGRGEGRNEERSDRTRRFEEAGRGAGDFLHRAGQRMADWFSGGGESRAYDERERNRGGRRGMGPQGYRRSDDRISEDAHERLTDDSWLDASNISVSVSGGEVTLSGTVDSREAKHRAERVVEDISGVSHVQNNLRVQKPGFLHSDSTGYGDTVAEAKMRRENPTATSTTGEGGGQSSAGRKQ